MSRWSTRRAQTEPIAALVAVFAVGIGLTAYAGVLGTALDPIGRNTAEPVLGRLHDEVTTGGVVRPSLLEAGVAAGPDGYRINVTVTVGGRRWAAGPAAPSHADRADRPASVVLEPGVARPGRLRVAVWS